MKEVRRASSLQHMLTIFAVLFLVVLVSGLLLRFVLSKTVLNDVYKGSLMHNAEIIELSLQHALIEEDLAGVRQIIINVSQKEGPQEVRLINLDGVIFASSIPDEVGVQMDLAQEQCQACHNKLTAQVPTARQLTSLNREEKVLFTAKPIENKVACQSCHSPERKHLGMILSENPTASQYGWDSRFDLGWAVGGLILFVVLSGAVIIVNQPRHTKNPKNMNGDSAENVTQLESRLAEIDEDMEEQESLLDFQRKSFDALLSISEGIVEEPSVNKVFVTALDALGKATAFDSIGMRLYDEKRKCFKLVTHYGISKTMMDVIECVPVDKGFQGDAYRTHWPVSVPDLSVDPRLSARTALDVGYRSLICVPLLAGDQILGTMELVTKTDKDWTDQEIRWLALVGRSIGILIRNVQLTERLRDLTVLQERSRLAQEIHDGLAQLVGSLRIWAEEAQSCLSEKDYSAVESALVKMQQTARDAYASIREEMLGLRDTIVDGEDIFSVFAEYLSRFQRQWGIETKLSFEDGKFDNKNISLPPSTEIQLLRIFQESLTNIRRHANATRVDVIVEASGNHMRLSIQDNGSGFFPEKVSKESLGLKIMRERAAIVGGSVEVVTQLDQGTRLQIEIPLS